MVGVEECSILWLDLLAHGSGHTLSSPWLECNGTFYIEFGFDEPSLKEYLASFDLEMEEYCRITF
jgi:hypothetical protein